eukprot:CCRYP_012348-RA/>CCRYP_012348-RA protein AED:0.11 eAED:0.11 QI:0/0/0/1/1/1/3/0/1327
MELLRAKAGRMTAYSITVDDSQLALVLLANIDSASSHDWGREFCPTLQTIRCRFAYNHAHNATTVAAILKELAGADGVRKLNDAPAPTGTANAVSNQVSLLTQLLQQQHDASNTEHTKAASAVQTDSDSSTKHNNRQRDRGRDNERNNRRGGRRGGQRGTQRSNSRHPPNPCPHCKKFARRKPHPKTPEDRCFWNKRYKGYRGKWICDEMEMVYVPRHKFAADMGGYPSESDDPPHTSPNPSRPQFTLSPKQPPPTPIPSNFKHKAQRKALERQARRLRLLNEATLLDRHISWAEDERTPQAKADTTSKQRRAIDTAHTIHPRKQRLSFGQALSETLRRTLNNLSTNRHVRFAAHTQIRHFDSQATTPLITIDSGADSHYLPETDRLAAGLSILRPSTRQVGVANGSTSTAKYVSQLPFPQLSPNAVLADSFVDFPQSLMSVGKTCDDGTIAIFTQSGVTVHKDTDVLITCQGEPLLIGARDAHGRYRIPLTQHKGRWQPRRPSKKAQQTLRHANSVYDLPSTEQAIRWMHAVCGYPVKSTWLKAVQAGNFIGWPLLTSRNIQKYFPESVETPKGHLNQSRKNVRSTKQKPIPLETFQSPQLVGRKLRDVYTHVYDTRDTIFSDQTGKFPYRSSSGNHYLMVMVDINSSAILVDPIKNRTDLELTRAYSTLITRLHRAGVVPRKHVLDNKISTAMKTLITDTYKMTYELVPPGCHRRNAAEVAIRNFKSHFLSILAGVADDFPMKLWDKLLPQAEITINLLRQSNATPTVSAYAHLNGPFNYNKMPLHPWDVVSRCMKSLMRAAHGPSIPSTAGSFACAAALKGITAPTKDITDLKALLDITATTAHTSNSVPRVRTPSNTPSLPRVLPTNDMAMSRVTRSMTNQFNLPSTTPVAIPTPRPTTKTKRRRHTKCAAVPDSAPARNTRSHTAAKAKLLAAPATNTRAKRISRIPKPVPILSTRMKRVDKEVHRALAVMDQDTGALLNYRALLRHPAYHDDWTTSSANEFGRLADGIGGRIKGTNTIRFIRKRDIPKDRVKDITYGQFVCTIRPEKKEPNRTRLVVGGDRINYPGEVATPTADMLAAKILFNSVISTVNARFMTVDISNFYLNTPLKRPEYIRMKLSDIPEEIITEYKLRDLVEPDDCVYIIIVLGMYGLPHAGLIANELLEKQLNKHGYQQSKLVPGLWKHKWRPIWFTLVVNDFRVKYVGKEHALHLKSVLESYYPLSTDWTGNRYIGIHLDWDYNNMVLAAHSDASYLSEPQARSGAGGHFFLSSNADIPPNNGAILNIAHIIKHVMASATEAELAALFITAREAVYIRIILMELGH